MMTGRFVTLALLLLTVMIGTVAISPPAEAIPSCLGAGDVTQLGSVGCVQGPLNFYDFAVSPAGVAAKILLGTFSSVIGQDVNLTFQVAHSPSPANLADILFSYTVKTIDGTAALAGVDLFNTGKNVTIRETVCGTAFLNGVCTTGLLADLIVTDNNFTKVTFLPLQSTLYIRKDIQLLEDSFISEFTNSHDLAATPEPATLLLLGTSLAGLGMAARKRARTAQPAA